MNVKIYSIFRNGKGNSKKLVPSISLSEARKKLKLSINEYFFFNDSIIDKNDEEEFSIQEINEDEKIYIESKNVSKSQISVDIYKKNGDKITSINIESKKISLDKIRKLLKNKIQNNFKFLSTEKFIAENLDESQFTIEDILNNKKIFINEDDNDYKTVNTENNIGKKN